MKQYCPTGRRNHGRPLKRLLDTWDRNGSTSDPTPWKIDDDDDEYTVHVKCLSALSFADHKFISRSIFVSFTVKLCSNPSLVLRMIPLWCVLVYCS
jgi:hypothetical protein